MIICFFLVKSDSSCIKINLTETMGKIKDGHSFDHMSASSLSLANLAWATATRLQDFIPNKKIHHEEC